MNYYVNRVAFQNLKLVLRMHRAAGLPLNEVLGFFSRDESREFIYANYEDLEPLRVDEALALPNAEQRMAAMAVLGPENVAEKMGAELLHRKTLSKKLRIWDENLELSTRIHEDTYELYRCEIDVNDEWNTLAVYYVKCLCPSTGRVYCLYVPEQVARARDAVAAIAWTMRIGGRPLTAREYRKLMYAES